MLLPLIIFVVPYFGIQSHTSEIKKNSHEFTANNLTEAMNYLQKEPTIWTFNVYKQGFIQVILMSNRWHKKLNLLMSSQNQSS